MKKVLIPLAAVGIAALVTWAGSQHGDRWGSAAALWWLVAGIFLIQGIGFLHSWRARTEKFFDLTGSLTYIIAALVALLAGHSLTWRQWLLGVMVIVWAGRLGSFLFARILRAGGDDRFEHILTSPTSLLRVWMMQGLWVTLTGLAAWTGITTAHRSDSAFGTCVSIVGLLVWLLGLTIEARADAEKRAFRANPANKGEFIRTGLWSRSRHPNYFGEIVLWTGVLLVAAPQLRGWQWVAVLSPVFVILLLTRVSGVPLLEAKADKRWGERTDYQDYKARTPVLVPLLRSR